MAFKLVEFISIKFLSDYYSTEDKKPLMSLAYH